MVLGAEAGSSQLRISLVCQRRESSVRLRQAGSSRIMTLMNWRGGAVWLPMAGSAAAGVAAFTVIFTVDDPTADRAERTIGGTLVAFPFLLLVLVQMACALYVGGRTGAPRTRGLLGITIGAALLAALVVWLFALQVARGYPWEQGVIVPALLSALLLAPLLPAWMVRAPASG